MSDSPTPVSPAHPEATDGDHTVIIARYSIWRPVLVNGGIALVLLFSIWLALHPERWGSYHWKSPGWIIWQQIEQGVLGVLGLLAVIAGLAVWLARGGHTMITLKDGTLRFPLGRTIALDDVTDVYATTTGEGRYKMKVIELARRDGEKHFIVRWALADKPDIVIARLNDALARHRAAQALAGPRP